MCGVIGMIVHGQSGFFQKHNKMLEQLIHAGMFRGEHATGLIGVMKDGDFGIMKEATDGYFFNMQYSGSKLDKELFSRGKAVIGHNRYKTMGKNTDENAHPFVEDDTFAMVHNGTLRNHYQIKNTEVDSQALTYLFKQAMDQEDWKTAMEEALGRVQGAFAVVWYDQKRNQLCMIRNKERPLALIRMQDTTLFCSEAPMGQWIAWRNQEKIEKTIILEEHKLYQFDLSKAGGDFSETNLSPKFQKGLQWVIQHGATTKVGTNTTKAGIERGKDTATWMLNTAQPLSKNAYKRFRNKLIGQKLTFELEDFFPNDPDHGESTKAQVVGYCLSGAYDLVEYRHEIEGLIWFNHSVTEDSLLKETHLTGEVVEVEFDGKARKLCVYVDRLRPTTEEVTT